MNRLPTRPCAGCGEPIHECMGFVKAGDIFNCQVPRELCGKCVERYEWTESGELKGKAPSLD